MSNTDDIECLNRSWIWSKNGRQLSITDLKESDVDIQEIAHALANTCRFGGHCNTYYSVAEHCVNVSMILEDEYNALRQVQLAGLLHDASEYMLTDVPKPFKLLMPEYTKFENKIMSVIEKVFKVQCHTDLIKEIDKRILVSEAHNLFDVNPKWVADYNVRPIEDFQSKYLCRYEPDAAYSAFMQRYDELRGWTL